VRWDQPRLLAALKQSPVSVKLIMGDADSTLGQGWLKALQHVQAPMVVVHGANHFMDGAHQFDLLDNTLRFLAHIPQPSSR
jgi:alpha/beta superfamily hydrolase